MQTQEQIQQSNAMSLLESAISVLVGYLLTVVAQLFLYPLFGIKIGVGNSLVLSLLLVVIAFFKNYAIRRFFNRFPNQAILEDNVAYGATNNEIA